MNYAARAKASYPTTARYLGFCNLPCFRTRQQIVMRDEYAHVLTSSSCFSSTSRKNKGPTKKKLSGSSLKWTQRHEKDPYVKNARILGSPSRAIFKLEEIDSMVNNYMQQQIKRKGGVVSNDTGHLKTKGLFHNSNAVVLDLGAAPGGWTKYVAQILGSDGLLIAIDLLPLDDRTVTFVEKSVSTPRFHFIQGDFNSQSIKTDVKDLLKAHNYNRAEYIISDMAANFTGDSMTDALRTLQLCEDALMLAVGSSCFDERSELEEDDGILINGGTFLCKYFACGQQHENDLKSAVKRNFEISTVLKPRASRKESAELYLFATGFRGGKEK